jgi:hypothetical protein
MNTLIIIAIVIVSLGLIRVIFSPYTGLFNLIMELVFIDVLMDILGELFNALD